MVSQQTPLLFLLHARRSGRRPFLFPLCRSCSSCYLLQSPPCLSFSRWTASSRAPVLCLCPASRPSPCAPHVFHLCSIKPAPPVYLSLCASLCFVSLSSFAFPTFIACHGFLLSIFSIFPVSSCFLVFSVCFWTLFFIKGHLLFSNLAPAFLGQPAYLTPWQTLHQKVTWTDKSWESLCRLKMALQSTLTLGYAHDQTIYTNCWWREMIYLCFRNMEVSWDH